MTTHKVKIHKHADNILSQIRGLMFRNKKINVLFHFDKCDIHPIHSWFVFYEFDAYYLDESYKVVDVYKNIKPWHGITPNHNACYLLEISTGDYNIKLNDKILV